MTKLIKNNLGNIVVTILAILPLVIWFFMLPISSRFLSPGATFRSLGQTTGLLGMALLSINFILATRFKFLDKAFDGLNRVYIKHHTIGALSFCLLLFHPAFLTIQYLFVSLKFSFLFLVSTADWPTNLGKLSLLIFIVLMAITFYFKFKYQIWKNTHKYLGIVLLSGGAHMLFVPSDISNNAVLKYYMLGLVCFAVFSYLYRTIFGVYKKSEYKYRLEKVTRINDSVVELKLIPTDKKMEFSPGQFIFLRFNMPTEETGGKSILSESHPFSITSSSNDGAISLGVKSLGDYTSMVYLLKPGATCLIEGPFGAFSYKKAKSKKQIWIAGGIGITPFLGMAREINTLHNNDYKIDLFYSVKNASEEAFGNELLQISKQNENFKYHPYFSEKNGPISADVISRNYDISGAEVLLCGPAGFMKTLRNQFVKLGLSNDKIYSEEFSIN